MYIKYGWCKLSLLMVVSFFFKFFILLKIKLERIKLIYGIITDCLSVMCNFLVLLMDILLFV